tara:strand:+ start:2308 stop:3066 length:759 start_codon:yes stop_codon:yes gene_type:complete
MNFETITQRIENRKSLDFGSIFSKSIALFKEVWLQGFITLLLNFLCMIPVLIIFYLPLMIMGIADPQLMKSEDPPAVLMIAMAVLMPVLMVGSMFVVLTLTAGFYRICKHKDFNDSSADSYFYFFRKPYLGRTLQLSFVSLGLMILGILTCGLGVIYLAVPFSLFPVFLAFDDELSALEIVKSSFALGNKNWLVIFGLLLVLGLLAELGVLLCLVGVLFTAMLSKVPAYFVYKEGVGFSTDTVESTTSTSNF